MKKLLLCADDFGQSTPISLGILSLLKKNRLSAVSCMSEGPAFLDSIDELRSLREVHHFDIGLHFNLTFPFEISEARSLAFWMKSSLLSRIPKEEIRLKLQIQLDHFESLLGFAPDFVDGHQHVHAFKGIREVFFSVLKERYPDRSVYLRSPEITPFKNLLPKDTSLVSKAKLKFKSMVLSHFVSGFSDEAKANGFRVNAQFLGIYSFGLATSFEKFLPFWLSKCEDGALMMCHPGNEDAIKDSNDPIGKARFAEYQYLNAPEFPFELKRNNVSLARFQDLT